MENPIDLISFLIKLSFHYRFRGKENQVTNLGYCWTREVRRTFCEYRGFLGGVSPSSPNPVNRSPLSFINEFNCSLNASLKIIQQRIACSFEINDHVPLFPSVPWINSAKIRAGNTRTQRRNFSALWVQLYPRADPGFFFAGVHHWEGEVRVRIPASSP